MVYIAYKFSSCPDKNQLRQHLESISKSIEKTGKKTFVLYRDKKDWNPSNSNKLHSAFYMILKLFQAKKVLIFINENSPSAGLNFELKYANILHKPIVLLIKKDIQEPSYRATAKYIVEYSDANNLSKSLEKAVAHLN